MDDRADLHRLVRAIWECDGDTRHDASRADVIPMLEEHTERGTHADRGRGGSRLCDQRRPGLRGTAADDGRYEPVPAGTQGGAFGGAGRAVGGGERVDTNTLVLLYQAGAERAFEALAERFEQRMVRNARHWGGDAAEYHQRQLLALWNVARRDKPDGRPVTDAYVRAALWNACLDYCRELRRRADREVPLLDVLPDRRSVTAPAEGRMLARQMETELEQLTPACRDVAQLRAVGLAVVEIALVLQVPLGTVKSRLHQVRKALATKPAWAEAGARRARRATA